MKLNKRYVRSIRENRAFYISSTVLTMVTLLLYFLCTIAGNAILDFGEEFFERNHLEDAHFSTYLPIPGEELEEWEKKYHLTLEAQSYINIETDGVTARVFEHTKKIDLYEVTEGRDVQSDNEIVISEGYAVKNKIKIGDEIKIGEKGYAVVGFMQRPDYLYMLENEDDSYKNISTFYLCYMSDGEYEKLGAGTCQYLVRYGETSDMQAFRKAVNEKYYMSSYSSAAENPRITMVDEQAYMFIIMGYIMLCIMPLIAVALISIIISRKVKTEQRMIGTLSALGYKKWQLMRHYAGFAAIPGLVGGILTAVFSAIAAQPFSEIGLQDYEPMRITGHLNPVDAVLGIIIPTVMYILTALIAVARLLKKDTVVLLGGNADGNKKRTKILADKKISFRKKLAIRSLAGNPARSFVVLLGVFLGAFIILFGQGMFDSINHMGEDLEEAGGSYEYQYILNELLTENTYGGEAMVVSAVESGSGKTISVIGTDSENPYLDFKDKNGNAVLLEQGYYITSLAQITMGWQQGDKVALCNPFTLEEKEIEIAGVIQNNFQKSIITSKAFAAELTGLEEDHFNCIISNIRLDIPDEKIAQETHRLDISEQVDTMMDQMGFILWTVLVLGAIICVAAVYVAVDMLVAESRGNISMLKVLGYNDRQINKIVLRSHHVLLPIGIVLSIPFVYVAAHAMFRMVVDYGVILINTYISPESYVITILAMAACYFGSLCLLRRKVKKVDMVESLKDNRE